MEQSNKSEHSQAVEKILEKNGHRMPIKPTPSRFDYVKLQMSVLEAGIEQLQSPRAKALALTNLEQAYMWIGKAIRDDQIARNGSAELQEERKDG